MKNLNLPNLQRVKVPQPVAQNREIKDREAMAIRIVERA